MSPTKGKRAAVYRRISRDPEGLREGVERQDQDTKRLAKRLGVKIVAEYEDNDAGASTLSKKPRPRYDAMLADARAGGFDVILAYSNSRLTRRLRELLDLIDLHKETGVEIHTVVSGSDDLATADGQMVAQIKASVDQAEAARIGERLRRAFLQKAQRGDVQNGARAFGWAEDKVSLHPTEAPLLRQAVQDVIDGVPTREVARRWNEAGVTTVPRRVRGEDGEWREDEDGEPVVRGNAWTHTSVRAVLRNPRLAGWKVHQRAKALADWRREAARAEEAGRAAPARPGWAALVARDEGGERVRGAWEPLVDQDTFDALQAALDGRQPKARRGARKYLLSGVLRCGVCGSRMHGFRTPTGHAYTCAAAYEGGGSDHTCTIAGVQTDALLRLLVAERVRTQDLSGEPAAPREWEGEARLRQIPGQVRELMAAFNSGVLSGAVVFPQVQALEAEQARLEAERPAAAPRPVPVSADDLGGLDLDRERAVTESLVAAVVVAKAAHKGARWSADRVEVAWR